MIQSPPPLLQLPLTDEESNSYFDKHTDRIASIFIKINEEFKKEFFLKKEDIPLENVKYARINEFSACLCSSVIQTTSLNERITTYFFVTISKSGEPGIRASLGISSKGFGDMDKPVFTTLMTTINDGSECLPEFDSLINSSAFHLLNTHAKRIGEELSP